MGRKYYVESDRKPVYKFAISGYCYSYMYYDAGYIMSFPVFPKRKGSGRHKLGRWNG